MKTIVLSLIADNKIKHRLDDGTFEYMRRKFPKVYQEESSNGARSWKEATLQMVEKLFKYDRIIIDDSLAQGFIWELASQMSAYHNMHSAVDNYRLDIVFSREDVVSYESTKCLVFEVDYIDADGSHPNPCIVTEHNIDKVTKVMELSGAKEILSIKKIETPDSGISK